MLVLSSIDVYIDFTMKPRNFKTTIKSDFPGDAILLRGFCYLGMAVGAVLFGRPHFLFEAGLFNTTAAFNCAQLFLWTPCPQLINRN